MCDLGCVNPPIGEAILWAVVAGTNSCSLSGYLSCQDRVLVKHAIAGRYPS
jgi:hypothetical protein